MDTPPSAHTRTPIHTRAVTYRGFARSDGLWDIEGRLVDTKDYILERFGRVPLPAGEPAHDMFVRVTVDDDLKIVDIQTGMAATPFGECINTAEPVRRLIGATLGRGWRKAIESAIGGVQGCTHMRELLFNLATAALQSVPSYIDHQRRQRGDSPPELTTVPAYVDQCLSWRRDGPAVQRIHPQFFLAPSKPAADFQIKKASSD